MEYAKTMDDYMMQLIELDKSQKAYGVAINVMNYFKAELARKGQLPPDQRAQAHEDAFNATKSALEGMIERYCHKVL